MNASKRTGRLGKAFSDSLIIEHKSQTRFNGKLKGPWWLGAGRALLFTFVLVTSVFVLTIRLFHLTVITGHQYRVLADSNRTRELIRHAPRGLLVDRAEKPLVANVPQFRLMYPCTDDASRMCARRLTKAEGEAMQEAGLPDGHFLEVDYIREYKYPYALSHVTGFTGELTPDELSEEYYTLRQYLLGDRIGRTGAEAVFEDELRGRNGKELVEVDASGKILRTLGVDHETSGEDVHLSVDADLATVVARAFPKDMKGAVVVSKPQTGEILALYSSPSFDTNKFTLGMTQEEYTGMVDNPDRPLFDRAIGGVYPPASTFKLVTSIAGLEDGSITESTTYEDTGILHVGEFSFANWYYTKYGGTDGQVSLTKALARSNDIYFYKAGEAIGITSLASWARKLGIGAPLGIELSGEASGLMPDAAWKKIRFNTASDRKARHDQWYLGDTYHIAIGQGYLLTTPLQVNAWTNVVANGGKLCKPTIRKFDRLHQSSCEDLDIDQEHLDVITQGMVDACSPGGTAWPLFDFGIPDPTYLADNPDASPSAVPKKHIPVACKTGTAEITAESDTTHAWITVFAPVEDRNQSLLDKSGDGAEISITVLVENGGEGSEVAAPVAKTILEEWFKR